MLEAKLRNQKGYGTGRHLDTKESVLGVGTNMCVMESTWIFVVSDKILFDGQCLSPRVLAGVVVKTCVLDCVVRLASQCRDGFCL